MITDNLKYGECPRRLSRARRAILSELCMLRTHPSAEELFRLVRRRLRRISRGTVYRNLEVLRGLGLVRRLDGGSQARYDGDLFDHDHLVCAKCGRIEDVARAVPPDAVARLENRHEFQVTYVRSEFHGVCKVCRATPVAGSRR